METISFAIEFWSKVSRSRALRVRCRVGVLRRPSEWLVNHEQCATLLAGDDEGFVSAA
jgi:hypothetical protein